MNLTFAIADARRYLGFLISSKMVYSRAPFICRWVLKGAVINLPVSCDMSIRLIDNKRIEEIPYARVGFHIRECPDIVSIVLNGHIHVWVASHQYTITAQYAATDSITEGAYERHGER